jgi:phosphatidylserine/phosphatidylglycerophosphate/cardiolipin synthase-like enzyme
MRRPPGADPVSTSTIGRVLRGAGGLPWVGLTVIVSDVSGIFDRAELGRGRTGADGGFTVTYGADPSTATLGPRTLLVEVTDPVDRRLARTEQVDVAAAVLTVPDFVVRPADGEGLLVTLGSGTPSFVSTGNAITLLIDNVEAWTHLGRLFSGATSSIEFMQMEFDVPEDFEPNPGDEKPVAVFDFGPPVPTATALRRVNTPLDVRPERVLESRARLDKVVVRIMISQPVLEHRLLLLGGVFAVVGAFVAALVGGLLEMLGIGTTRDEVEQYFAATGQLGIWVEGAPTPAFGPTHAKIVVVDGTEAVSAGSPFMQSYFGDPLHPIDDPRRGDNNGHPIHDVSVAVRGPAVADMHQAFRLHWNTHVPAHPIEPVTPAPPEPPGDMTVKLQVVRTLIGGRFADPAAGEKGVLEAYLRAIAVAQDLIYLENQYFTNDAIADALVLALKARPNLQVIVLINIDPDVPGYRTWQRKLIVRMRKALEVPELQRFGVFTRWSQEPSGPGHPRARIVPNYLHSKVALIDDRWATVGSANLDGASLDAFQLLHAIQPGAEVRNSEVNLVVLPEAPGPVAAVEQLRRRLWAEHLGYWSAPGVPDPDHVALLAPSADGWVHLWTERAQDKLDRLRSNPNAVAPASILYWPHVDRPVDEPRNYLRELLVDRPDLDVLAKTAKFDFKTGAWTSDAKLDD